MFSVIYGRSLRCYCFITVRGHLHDREVYASLQFLGNMTSCFLKICLIKLKKLEKEWLFIAAIT